MADIYNTFIDQGATWQRVIIYNDSNGDPVNITNNTAAMQLRTSPLANNAVLTLTTENGGISIVGGLGKLTITASATQTAALKPQKYTYDLELYSPGGIVTRLMQGTILVNPETTRT